MTVAAALADDRVRARLQAEVRRSRRAAGLPPTIEDDRTLDQVASLLKEPGRP